ncbi:hypothetical protein PC9H_004036 [Pleurotus ostreatus]|uniref:MFS general substrate transporter n=1 Tax=Pleurotus ostreatus TaxID=5322 RepID=A0A8H6ZZI6_PLEOS|nr:uncharacterized protein PC9H_004036 [Pleurotus ostreatus]KAF7437200.1 hypothetical protein PC9H_004036 [Pleurotus ostreatus]
MSARRKGASGAKLSKTALSDSSGDMLDPRVMTTSLDEIHISPRTPRMDQDGDDELEMNLLGDEERRRAAPGFNGSARSHESETKRAISVRDKQGMVLLCVLYLIQGVPLGLALGTFLGNDLVHSSNCYLGSVPFLLKEHLSYSQLGTFALSSYPYSLKLLWSPIVDSVFSTSIGRRKSWIIPMQLIVGTLMMYISLNVQKLLDDPGNYVTELTVVFTSLVFFSATQDIAVDGWALTLLSPDCLSYASTCQTIGLNTGFFASFTVFLAFNSEEFAKKWGVPHLTLSGYLKFWSLMCYAVTLWLILFKREDKEVVTEADMSISGVYKQIWAICKLKHVQSLIVVHLFAKVAFAAHEASTSLKMVEKGFKREDLAIAVLIDFPFQIAGGWLAAKWSRGDRPLRPWIYAFWPRIGLALVATVLINWFPAPPISMGFFMFLILHTVLSSFASTVQFVGISAFHTRVSDPLIGGTYMTLLNTFTNMGGTWPKWFVLKGIDTFTIAECKLPGSNLELKSKVLECVTETGKTTCKQLSGECVIQRDGYYIVSAICMVFGITFLLAYIIPTARKLQALPTSKWRIKMQ